MTGLLLSGIGRVQHTSLFSCCIFDFTSSKPVLQILSALFTRYIFFHDENGKCTLFSISGNQHTDFCSCILMQKCSCKPPSLSVLYLLHSSNCIDNSQLLALCPLLLIPATRGRIMQVSLKDVNTCKFQVWVFSSNFYLGKFPIIFDRE